MTQPPTGLDEATVRAWFPVLVANADRLCRDAALLLHHGSAGSALSSGVLALEELAKATHIADLAAEGRPLVLDADTLKRWKQHRLKLPPALLATLQAEGGPELLAALTPDGAGRFELDEDAEPAVQGLAVLVWTFLALGASALHLHDTRMMSTYSEARPDGGVISPLSVGREQAEPVVAAAQAVLADLRRKVEAVPETLTFDLPPAASEI